MRNAMRAWAVLVVGEWLAAVPALPAQEKPQHTAVTPLPRSEQWLERHKKFVETAKQRDIDVLFLGDSITDSWRTFNEERQTGGRRVWEKEFSPLKAANFGISGDRTQHVLWRLQNGELEGIQPKAAVLMIGTNNSNGTDNTAEEIADGITAIVREVRRRSPSTKILLLGIFPRGAKPNPQRDKIKEVNAAVAKLDDGGKTVRYLDIGDKFLEPDGSLSPEIMPDYLHLSEKGYQIWADAIKGPLHEMLGKK
jgi:lysophospholipase L1-like esterase